VCSALTEAAQSALSGTGGEVPVAGGALPSVMSALGVRCGRLAELADELGIVGRRFGARLAGTGRAIAIKMESPAAETVEVTVDAARYPFGGITDGATVVARTGFGALERTCEAATSA
jgi:hypothetical protein